MLILCDGIANLGWFQQKFPFGGGGDERPMGGALLRFNTFGELNGIRAGDRSGVTVIDTWHFNGQAYR